VTAAEARCGQPTIKGQHIQTDLGCHDPQPMSSLAFGREWKIRGKLSCVRGFAVVKTAAFLSIFAAAATAAISIAAIPAVCGSAASSAAPQTSVIRKVSKEDLIIGTVSSPIVSDWPRHA
jgi:hypothetical protein